MFLLLVCHHRVFGILLGKGILDYTISPLFECAWVSKLEFERVANERVTSLQYVCVISTWSLEFSWLLNDNPTVKAMAISYNWLFQWNYTFYKWCFLSTYNWYNSGHNCMVLLLMDAPIPEIAPGHRRRDRFKNRQAQAAQTLPQAGGVWEIGRITKWPFLIWVNHLYLGKFDHELTTSEHWKS